MAGSAAHIGIGFPETMPHDVRPGDTHAALNLLQKVYVEQGRVGKLDWDAIASSKAARAFRLEPVARGIDKLVELKYLTFDGKSYTPTDKLSSRVIS